MNKIQLGILRAALQDYREGLEESYGVDQPVIESVKNLSDKLSEELAHVRAGHTKFYVWYSDDTVGDYFSITGILWVDSQSIFDAAKLLCNRRGVEFNSDADFGGLDLTHGTLAAENEEVN